MRYEQFYQEQLEKYKKRRHFLTKKLPIILICVGVLLGAIITLIFTSGTPYDYGINDLCYGDVISRTPKSFLASAEYEYLVDGSFQKEAPTDPGEYVYRICSTSLFGMKKYSKEHTFKIEKAEIEIKVLDTEVDYGKKPEKLDAKLPYNERISSFDIEYEDTHKLTTNVWAKDVIILDENDEDITDNYYIKYAVSEITFTKVPLIITLNDKEKVYDGTPLKFEDEDDYTVEGLMSDAFVEVKTLGSQTLVGESEYEVASVIVKDDNGIEFETYDYVINNGKLKVTKKDINVETKDLTITFNGDAQELEEYTLKEEIPDNVKVNPLVLKNPGSYDYELTINLLDSNNNDVTDCYNIIYKYGSVTVNKADIKVKLDDLEVTYSGQTHFDVTYTLVSGSLFDSELTVVGESSIREAGVGTLNEYAYMIKNDNKDISDCFNVEFESSEIVIKKKALSVKPKDVSIEYSSSSYESDEFEAEGLAKDDTITVKSIASITSIGQTKLEIFDISIMHGLTDVSSSYEIEMDDATLNVTKRKIKVAVKTVICFYGDTINLDEYDEEGLLDGDTLNISKFSYSLNIGKNDIVIYDENWSVTDGVNDRTEFYQISSVTGSIIYNKKPITVSIAKKTKVYDGTSLELEVEDIFLKEGELVNSQTISFRLGSNPDSLTNVGEKIVVLSEDNIVIKDSDDREGDGLNQYKKYYAITYEEGLLKVIPKQIVVTSLSIEKPYDYGVLTCHEFTYSDLVNTDQVIEVTFKSELLYIGSIKNEIDSVKIYEDSSKELDVTSNYSISIYEGTLTYTERS